MLANLFITVIYQPFLNVLVGFYWLLGLVSEGKPDMGIAVIFLTVLVRLLLLPISLSGDKTEDERREISRKIKEAELMYKTEPIKAEAAKKSIIRKSRKVMAGEVINLIIQVTIALMLWKIFQSGLPGADFHLIYSFMPDVHLPFNLLFLGKYDLSHTSFTLNIIQSLLIFILETISLYTSPYKVSRDEVVRMQLVLPTVSFIIFMGLPAGKKVFVITSLVFSILLLIFKVVRRKYLEYVKKNEDEQKADVESSGTEKIVNEV